MKLFKQDQNTVQEVRNPCFRSRAELQRSTESQIANILAFLENLLSVTHKVMIFSHNMNSKDKWKKEAIKVHNQLLKKWKL